MSAWLAADSAEHPAFPGIFGYWSVGPPLGDGKQAGLDQAKVVEKGEDAGVRAGCGLVNGAGVDRSNSCCCLRAWVCGHMGHDKVAARRCGVSEPGDDRVR